MLAFLLWLVLGLSRWLWQPLPDRFSKRPTLQLAATARPVRNLPKPPWVRRELIRLKAWSPELGCRVIAEVFNRQFADRRVTVGKSYVAKLLRESRAEVVRLRRMLKHHVPRPMPCNLRLKFQVQHPTHARVLRCQEQEPIPT